MRDLLGTMIVGVGMGYALSRMGFSTWDEVHNMFVFADLRLLFTFMAAVMGLVVAWRLVVMASPVKPHWPERALHKGTIAGGVLFGVGWAICGACPSIALVQLGEGQLAALWTLGGIFAGNWIYGLVHERWFRWDLGSCVDD